jgi:hypothetical protein
MSNDNEKPEVSLLDLIVVLFKYHKTILWGTICLTLLFSLFTFFSSPKSGKKLTTQVKQKYLAETTLLVNEGVFKILPNNIIVDPRWPIHLAESAYLTNIHNIGTKLRKYNSITDISGYQADSLEYDTYIKNVFLTSICKIDITDGYVIKISLLSEDPTAAASFITELTTEAEEYTNMLFNTQNHQYMLPAGKLAVTKYSAEGTGNVSAIAQSPSKSRLIIKDIVAAVIFFFSFCFIAFSLNAFKSIKEDKNIRKKLIDAWNAGK